MDENRKRALAAALSQIERQFDGKSRPLLKPIRFGEQTSLMPFDNLLGNVHAQTTSLNVLDLIHIELASFSEHFG